MIPAPQYTIHEAVGVCLDAALRAIAEVRALARVPGPRGEPGPEGKRGLQGERGVKGETGRNAADLALLQEYIDQRVERTLKAATVTTLDGGRTLLFSLEGTVVREVKTAVVLDCGVWQEGETYEAGDGVTMGGSFFIAQTDTTTAKPGKSDEWRLAVKRGTDGRDARTEHALEPVRFK